MKKIAIIGGGPAGLSTAFHLTQRENWQDQYKITVYQPGWRLGGKGATGRNADHQMRIEEHGIHGFCRFYFNTWIMMNQVFSQISGEGRAQLATPTIGQAFLPSSLTYAISASDSRFFTEVTAYPPLPGNPWDDPETTPVNWVYVVEGLKRLILERHFIDPAAALKGEDLNRAFEGSPGPGAEAPNFWIKRAYRRWRRGQLFRAFADSVDKATRAGSLGEEGWSDDIRRRLGNLQKSLEETIAEHESQDLGHSRSLSLADILVAMFIGIIDDGLINGEKDADEEVDGQTVRDWLEGHGAQNYSLTSQAFVTVHNILFASPNGNCNRYPELSAASWLNWMLRGGLGKGGYFYFMAAGTGESVILPLYLYLRERGVDFEFFHRLENVDIQGPAGERSVVKLQFERQARPLGDGYDPLIEVATKIHGKQREFKAWPNQPNWEQLKGGDRDREAGVDFESSTPLGREERVVSAGDDFDAVVFAFPPSVAELVGLNTEPIWQRTIDLLTTTATQAAQLWLRSSTEDLGWRIPDPHPPTSRFASANFPNPLNAMVAFDDVLEYEDWTGEDKPAGLIYLCSQMQELEGYSTPMNELRVRCNVASTLHLSGNFLGDEARLPENQRHDWMTVDFDLLFGAGEGVERLESQYVRANTDPMELYVQAPPGSAGGRMQAWDTGLSNGVAAGDWMYTGFNIGAFESAVTGGKLAAFALAGNMADLDHIIGFDFLHPEAGRKAKAAVNSGQVPILKPDDDVSPSA